MPEKNGYKADVVTKRYRADVETKRYRADVDFDRTAGNILASETGVFFATEDGKVFTAE